MIILDLYLIYNYDFFRLLFFTYVFSLIFTPYILFPFDRGIAMVMEGIAKVTYPGVTSEKILAQVNQTADALKKPKKLWTESESSDLEGTYIHTCKHAFFFFLRIIFIIFPLDA